MSEMKKYVTRKILLSGVVVVCFVAIITAGIGAGKGVRSQRISEVTSRRVLVEAARSGGLREAARIQGDYVATLNTSSWVKHDVQSLAKGSMAVVIGSALENVCNLSPDGRQITTDYKVRVEEVLKGNVQLGDVISVSLPGGRVLFEDGTSAEIVTPTFIKMENGKGYILFLSDRGSVTESFSVTGGSQGLFEILGDGSVKPLGNVSDPIARKYGRETEARGFLKEARQMTKKWPKPSTCCN
jgi:hypothetical protein